MDQAGGVRGGEAVGDLDGQVEELARGIDWRDRRALNKFHYQVIRPDVVELADVGMIEGSDCAGFAVETVGEDGGGGLDGDGTV